MSPKPYILISGSSSGIGQDLAIKLSKKNNIIICGRNEDKLNTTFQLCNNQLNLIWNYDFSDIDNISENLTSFITSMDINISSFVHCAGLVKIMPQRLIKNKDIYDSMNVNYASAINIVSTLLKKKVNQSVLKDIIFISSVWSNFGAKGYSLYSASKGALDSAMRSLALELAPSIRVNSIVLGAIKTHMALGTFSDPEIVKNLDNQYPLGTGTVEDASSAAEFLLSDKSRWITGQQIVVDGGRTANMSLK